MNKDFITPGVARQAYAPPVTELVPFVLEGNLCGSYTVPTVQEEDMYWDD